MKKNEFGNKIKTNMNNYYVYIYWRLDTNEPFYVGKGKGDRWRYLTWKHNLCNGAIPLMLEDNALRKKIEDFAILVAKKISLTSTNLS